MDSRRDAKYSTMQTVHSTPPPAGQAGFAQAQHNDSGDVTLNFVQREKREGEGFFEESRKKKNDDVKEGDERRSLQN